MEKSPNPNSFYSSKDSPLEKGPTTIMDQIQQIMEEISMHSRINMDSQGTPNPINMDHRAMGSSMDSNTVSKIMVSLSNMDSTADSTDSNMVSLSQVSQASKDNTVNMLLPRLRCTSPQAVTKV